jgi:hypothetical protein
MNVLGVENCPFGWQGQYKEHVGECIVILFTHGFIGPMDLAHFFAMVGSHNDI